MLRKNTCKAVIPNSAASSIALSNASSLPAIIMSATHATRYNITNRVKLYAHLGAALLKLVKRGTL